jgi:hypothetical protein
VSIDPFTVAKIWMLVKPIRFLRNRRRKKKGLPPLGETEVIDEMSAYNKLIAVVVGGILTILSRWVPGIENADTELIVQAIGTILTAVGVWAVPNKPNTPT